MKKILLVLLTILALTISVTNVKADRRLGESVYINENGVRIFKKDYTKLVQLGVLDAEIRLLTQDELDKYLSFNIDAKMTKKYFVKTEYPVIDGNVVPNQILMNEEDFYQEYAERQAAQNTETAPTETGTMAPMAVVSDQVVDTSNLNIFTVTVSFDGCKGTFGEFLVKTNMEWLVAPTMRYDDITGVAFPSTVDVKEKVVNDIPYPDFTNKLIYKETYRKATTDQNYTITVTEKTTTIDYDDTRNYHLYEESLASKVDLPDDLPMPPDYSYIYSDFLITMDVTLVATTNIISSNIVGIYSHQYGSGAFSWNDVIVKTEDPFFRYIDNYFVDDVNYEPPFVGEFHMTGLHSGHVYVITKDATGHTFTCTECGYTYFEEHILVDEVCTVCGYSAHVHVYETFVQYNASSHTATCYCGYSELQDHAFTYVSTATYHYRKCIRCQYRSANQLHVYVTINGIRFCSVCGYGSSIIQYSAPLNVQ